MITLNEHILREFLIGYLVHYLHKNNGIITFPFIINDLVKGILLLPISLPLTLANWAGKACWIAYKLVRWMV